MNDIIYIEIGGKVITSHELARHLLSLSDKPLQIYDGVSGGMLDIDTIEENSRTVDLNID